MEQILSYNFWQNFKEPIPARASTESSISLSTNAPLAALTAESITLLLSEETAIPVILLMLNTTLHAQNVATRSLSQEMESNVTMETTPMGMAAPVLAK